VTGMAEAGTAVPGERGIAGEGWSLRAVITPTCPNVLRGNGLAAIGGRA
jgi:hypothetical protein